MTECISTTTCHAKPSILSLDGGVSRRFEECVSLRSWQHGSMKYPPCQWNFQLKYGTSSTSHISSMLPTHARFVSALMCGLLLFTWLRWTQLYRYTARLSSCGDGPSVPLDLVHHSNAAMPGSVASPYEPEAQQVNRPLDVLASTSARLSAATTSPPALRQNALPDQQNDPPQRTVLNRNLLAYVFYATEDNYACSCLVNIHRLRNIFNSTIAIHILVTSAVTNPLIDAYRARNVTVHVETPPPLAVPEGGYYQNCLLKLVAFKMHRLAPHLKRILVLDSDQLIMKPLDHLFEGLPEVDLAAPRA